MTVESNDEGRVVHGCCEASLDRLTLNDGKWEFGLDEGYGWYGIPVSYCPWCGILLLIERTEMARPKNGLLSADLEVKLEKRKGEECPKCFGSGKVPCQESYYEDDKGTLCSRCHGTGKRS